jgi:hypothetical protein
MENTPGIVICEALALDFVRMALRLMRPARIIEMG